VATFIMDVRGGKALAAKLRKLPNKISNKIQRKGLRAGAKLIQRAAKKLAPKDTGLLRSSLRVRAGKPRKGKVAVRVMTGEGDYKGETFYGSFLEYGHRLGHRKLGSQRKMIPAKPYMKPAFEQNKDAAVKAVRQAIREGIREAKSITRRGGK
jgi:HK97 gp10 family phage protein